MLLSQTTLAGNAALGDVAALTTPIINELQVLLGGIFGIYVVLVIVRIYFEHRRVKILKAILYDLDQRNIHDGLSYSKQRLGFFRRMYRKYIAWYHTKFVKLSSKRK